MRTEGVGVFFMKYFRHRDSTAARFSAAARTYGRRAGLQAGVAKSLVRRIGTAGHPSSILEIGCGSGVLTRLLIRRFPAARIDATDISDEMLEEARTSYDCGGRVVWRRCAAEDIGAKAKYDLVVSSSALHWVSGLEKVWRKIRGALKPGGRVAAALMIRGTLGNVRRLRNLVAPGKRPLADLPTARYVVTGLRAAGLVRVKTSISDVSIHVANGKLLLKMLHDQGLTGGGLSGRGIPLNRGELDWLIKALDRTATKRGIEIVYRVLYLEAWRKG